MRCYRTTGVLALLTATMWLPLARAADDGSASACAAVSDDEARLACYDSIFGEGAASPRQTATNGSSAAATQSAVATGTAAPTAPSNPQDDFGLSEAAKRSRDPETTAQLHPDSITDKVVSVGHRPTGELVVTLANGQVWIQLDMNTQARVGSGDTVTIKKASLGSYLLVTQSRAAVRVRRTK